MTPESLKEMVTFMQLRLMECCYQNQFGFLVYDSHGKPIGMLYSYLGIGITFKVDENRIVKIPGPKDDDQLKQYQERQTGQSR